MLAGKKSSTAHVNGVSAEPLLRIDIPSQVILSCLHLGLGTANDAVQKGVPALPSSSPRAPRRRGLCSSCGEATLPWTGRRTASCARSPSCCWRPAERGGRWRWRHGARRHGALGALAAD